MWVVSFDMSRECVHSPKLFCNVWGEFTPKSQTKSVTPVVKKAYKLYFGCKFCDQGKNWAPRSCCRRCSRYLHVWWKPSRCAISIFIVQETVIKHNQSHNSNIMTTCFRCLSSHLQVNNNEFKTKHHEVYKVYNTIKTIETYLNKLMGSHVKYV
jgi:hypothetical protein